jgi:hypothetical protein
MNTFKTILTRLKEIIAGVDDNSSQKIRDKDVAYALNIKHTTLASYKRRDKPPYQAILTYCHENRLDVRKVLFNEAEPIISFPPPVDDGKVRVKYFRNLDTYSRYLCLQ